MHFTSIEKVSNLKVYKSFFNSLSQSVYLTANGI